MAKSITKNDLIKSMADAADLKKVQAERALAAFTAAVQSALVEGNKVTLVGFGTFSVSNRAARQGRDPQSKAPIQIPASKSVKFKAGKAMKEAVNI